MNENGKRFWYLTLIILNIQVMFIAGTVRASAMETDLIKTDEIVVDTNENSNAGESSENDHLEFSSADISEGDENSFSVDDTEIKQINLLEEAWGVCGENLRWRIDSKGELLIQGAGPMYDYNNFPFAPWYKEGSATRIKKISFDGKVTSIGASAFKGCKKLQKLTIYTEKLTSDTVEANAFASTKSNIVIYVPYDYYDDYRYLLLARGISQNAVFYIF